MTAYRKKLIEVALPLEAQRPGIEAYASNLNPVAVLINKAMIEIPPKFAGKPPVNPNTLRTIPSRPVCAPNRRIGDGVARGRRMRRRRMRAGRPRSVSVRGRPSGG